MVGPCDVNIVRGLSSEGTSRPSPSILDVGQSPALSVTCSVQGRQTRKGKPRETAVGEGLTSFALVAFVFAFGCSYSMRVRLLIFTTSFAGRGASYLGGGWKLTSQQADTS